MALLGPVHRVLGGVVHVRRGIGHGVVVIAAQHDGSRRLAPDEVNHGCRVRAVADQVAEEHQTLRAGLARMLEAGVQRLKISMDVRQQGENHDRSEDEDARRRSNSSRRERRDSTNRNNFSAFAKRLSPRGPTFY